MSGRSRWSGHRHPDRRELRRAAGSPVSVLMHFASMRLRFARGEPTIRSKSGRARPPCRAFAVRRAARASKALLAPRRRLERQPRRTPSNRSAQAAPPQQERSQISCIGVDLRARKSASTRRRRYFLVKLRTVVRSGCLDARHHIAQNGASRRRRACPPAARQRQIGLDLSAACRCEQRRRVAVRKPSRCGVGLTDRLMWRSILPRDGRNLRPRNCTFRWFPRPNPPPLLFLSSNCQPFSLFQNFRVSASISLFPSNCFSPGVSSRFCRGHLPCAAGAGHR